MFLSLLAMAPDVSGPEVLPSVTAVSVADVSLGACSAGSTIPLTSASHRCSWTLTGFDAALYTIKVYENGIEVLSTTTATYFDRTVSGVVVNGPLMQYDDAWDYAVKIFRNSTSAAVATLSATTFPHTYGRCGDAL